MRHNGLADLGESGENEDIAERLENISKTIDKYRLAHMVDMKVQIEKYERIIDNFDKNLITPVCFYFTDILRASIINNRQIDINLIKYALEDVRSE